DLPGFFYRPLDKDSACLLIGTMGESATELEAKIAKIESVLAGYDVVEATGFQTDPKITTQYWNTRKGLFPIVAKGRKSGAAIIPEDVVFPMEHLVEGVEALTALFEKHNFPEATIMGHALEGNLHFMLAPTMTSKKKIKQFDAFMDELAEVVAVKYNGSLKGEHGTGRNIAPFVEAEWGEEIYQVMRDIKALFDPDKIFNPDVIITDNKKLHITSLKQIPVADKL
ncbi:4Fe-4S ferredoxin, partial [Tsukamurella sputi]